MGQIVPSRVFLVHGRGQHREKLVSFENALREAGIAPCNLVRVSSIFPPHCRLVSKAAGSRLLHHGQILFVVLSENATDEPGALISASIGVAIPDDPSHYGYLAEHSDLGKSARNVSLHTEYLAAEMLATKLGQRLRQPGPGEFGMFRMSSGLSLRTRSSTQTAKGVAGLWTTVVSAAVLIAD